MRRLRFVFILLWLLVCLCLMAQEQLLDSVARQLQLDEVTVSARRTTADPVLPVQRLGGAELQALSTYSVADAMRYFSGVQLKDYGGVGGLKTVDIRSMGTNHLGVFYDGLEIGNAQNGTVDLGKFSMDNIEEVALYNGQKSEIFQPAKDFAAAGTLYIKTRRPRFKAGKPYNVEVSMKAGSFGLANPSLLYEQRITDQIHLSVNAEYLYATGRYKFRYRRLLPNGEVAWDTTAVRGNGDVQSYRAEVGLFGYMDDGKWHVKGYVYGSEKGIPGAIVNNVWTNGQRQWDRNAFVQGNFTKELFRNYDFQVNAKYSNDYLHYLDGDTVSMYINDEFWQQELYASVANRYKVLRAIESAPRDMDWDVSLSVDYQFNWLRAAGTVAPDFVRPRRHTVLVSVATDWAWRWLRLQASVVSTSIIDKIQYPTKQTPEPAKQRTEFTPAVFFSYQPLLREQLFFRAFYKRQFRMPTFNDLYYADVGYTSLRPEVTNQYDGGVEYQKEWSRVVRRLTVKADGYFNQVKDKIVAIPKGNGQYRWQMQNLGYVEIRGLDFNTALTLEIVRDLYFTFTASYTYQRAQDKTDPQDKKTYNGQIAYIPQHSTSAAASVSWRGWQLNYSFIYVGERYSNSANILANYVPAWYTNDLSLSKELWFTSAGKIAKNGDKRWGMHIAGELNNFLNQQYEVIRNYPMPGINGKGIVKFLF